ncbi:uncharacterized protein EAE97_007063 [Botrytis byssoidea]|uniref:Uncharacterized protein n=1 Tax=Botrytis byssoidea TaxID=139641 RepID=A0A9P5IK94_9HELO|nr:uncharacterized protein EAE97_007063 [Botrytis byssoidea]KAF7940878.1 hypothetical protein EAE97_007063 [Botrytis byssoidea]
MAEDLEPNYSETKKRVDENVTERTSRRTSTAQWGSCRGRNIMLRDSSIISGPVAQPQIFHSRMVAKGRTSKFVEEISSDEDLQSVVKNMGAAKTFDEMPLPPGKVRSATACEEQTKAEEAECWFRRLLVAMGLPMPPVSDICIPWIFKLVAVQEPATLTNTGAIHPAIIPISNIPNQNNAMPEKESTTLPKMNVSSAWTLLQKVSTLVNNLSKSQEEAKLSRNTDSQAIEKLNNKVKSLENELKGVTQAFERRINQLESVIYRSK